jgi:hypothetical protein
MPFELSDSSFQFAAVERVYRLKYDTTINVKHSHFLCKVLTSMLGVFFQRTLNFDVFILSLQETVCWWSKLGNNR